jgi:type II secretory pathway pseudopilin PulG
MSFNPFRRTIEPDAEFMRSSISIHSQDMSAAIQSKGNRLSPADHGRKMTGVFSPETRSNAHPARLRKPSEDGYILLGVLILLAIFIIGMAAAAPKIAYDIQRDRDLETMQRGKQYIRAVQLYYKKFNAYPPNIDALVKTNEIRFLRKRYIDPVTGKDDWKPIMYCQNKAPLAMGFFGQPLGPASGCGPMAGIGPNGGNGIQGASPIGGQGPTSSTGTSMFGNNPTATGGPATGTLGNTGSLGSTSPTTGATGTTGAPGAPGTSGGTDTNGNPTGGLGDNGQTFGGGGIIGVSPATERKSILVYKKKDHYNQWEFTYSPMMEAQTMGGGNTGTIGQPVGGPGSGINGPGTGVNGPGAGGFGPGNNGGSTPIQPPPSQPPQQ